MKISNTIIFGLFSSIGRILTQKKGEMIFSLQYFLLELTSLF